MGRRVVCDSEACAVVVEEEEEESLRLHLESVSNMVVFYERRRKGILEGEDALRGALYSTYIHGTRTAPGVSKLEVHAPSHAHKGSDQTIHNA